LAHSSLKVFEGLPLKERLFVRGRLATAPLEAVAARAEGARLLDVGCGHGVLVALLAVGSPGRHVVGIDPDERKIDWARFGADCERRSPRLPSRRWRPSGRASSTRCSSPTCCICSRPPPRGRSSRARELFRRGGRLVLKEAEDDGSWRQKALFQEQLMSVCCGELTRAVRSVSHRARRSRRARAAGFAIEEVVPLARYSTPHLMIVARR
jgi:2-polyprenyl-6-hydroxyphenyl methylase/3-demethylubiquinone-9 3-methyltransferase